MNTRDILEHVVNIHNRLARIMVSGDDVILMGQSLVELRSLAQSLSDKFKYEANDKTEGAD